MRGGQKDQEQLQCCLGGRGGGGGRCRWPRDGGAYTPQSSACDRLLEAHCEKACAGAPSGCPARPECGCLVSPVGPGGRPQCFDSRCAAAYRPAALRLDECVPGEAPGCPVWRALGDGRYLAKKVPPPVGCRPGSPAGPSGPPGAWPVPGGQSGPAGLLLVVFLVVAAAYLAVFALGRAATRPPPKAPLPAAPLPPPQ